MAEPPPEFVKMSSEAPDEGAASASPHQVSVRLERGRSPKGFDIVICSYDANFGNDGALHGYIVRELELDMNDARELVVDWTHRVLAVPSRDAKRPIILVQVVSIGDEDKTNADALRSSLDTLMRRLDPLAETMIDALEHTPQSLWIPTLGTGAAGLDQRQSAHIIAEALSNALPFPLFQEFASEIVIAPPATIDTKTLSAIADVLRRALDNPDKSTRVFVTDTIDEDDGTTSEMPDRFHSDHALKDASEDDLGRDAIAEAIATNVTRVWKEQKASRRPFAIHLSGRWGSGKSSILGFLAAKLRAETTWHPDGWVVVDYNAWRMQEAGPPWWSLLTTVRDQGFAALGPRGRGPRLRDWAWRNTRIALPWLLTLAAILLIVVVYYGISSTDTATEVKTTETTTSSETERGTQKVVVKTVEPLKSPNVFTGADNPWAFVLTITTALGSLGVLAKIVQSWNKSASETAEAVRDLHSDPTAVIKARFENIIRTIDRPVAVFIDDLDRCDARFVVDLLQGLQTAYAHVEVLYVVASDRDWIVSAYNQVYQGFCGELSKPGAPLGYLFVKKIFQLAVAVPDLAASDRGRLTRALLRTQSEAPAPTASRADRAEDIRKAAAEGDLSRVSAIQSDALKEGQNLADEVMRAVTDPENQARLRHRLLDYADLFDGNPRAIKRLINALTFRQGYILTAAEDIPFDTVARWTILALRFPYTADILAARPGTAVPHAPNEAFPDPERIRAILGELDEAAIEKVSAFG